MCVCLFACGHVHMTAGALGGQRHQIPWSWSYRWLGASCQRCWELNLSPLEEQQALFTSELFLSSFVLSLSICLSVCLSSSQCYCLLQYPRHLMCKPRALLLYCLFLTTFIYTFFCAFITYCVPINFLQSKENRFPVLTLWYCV